MNPERTNDDVQSASRTALGYKELIWLVASCGGLLIVYLSPLREHLTHIEVIKADFQALGALAPLAFVVVMSALCALGLPRLLIHPIGGLAFGFAGGLLWSLTATVAGAYATFLYARWAGRDVLLGRWPALGRLTLRLEGRGPATVALIRQLPNPAVLTSVLLGVSPIGHGAFLLGTAVGSLPAAIPATLIGGSIGKSTAELRFGYVALALASLLILWAASGGVAFVRRRRSASINVGPLAAVEAESQRPPA
ncbi:MAG TPA: VTT domain-containing protein [Kiritimatiellia bacterium]|nr:VTT domain-containing protein [Kiritimatiellia bacterium]